MVKYAIHFQHEVKLTLSSQFYSCHAQSWGLCIIWHIARIQLWHHPWTSFCCCTFGLECAISVVWAFKSPPSHLVGESNTSSLEKDHLKLSQVPLVCPLLGCYESLNFYLRLILWTMLLRQNLHHKIVLEYRGNIFQYKFVTVRKKIWIQMFKNALRCLFWFVIVVALA